MNIGNTILVIVMWFGIWECLNTLVEVGFANKIHRAILYGLIGLTSLYILKSQSLDTSR